MGSQLLRVWMVVGLVVSSATAQGLEAADPMQIRVLVFNRASVEETTVLAAEKTAAKIYGLAGLAIVWTNCRAQAEMEIEACRPTSDPDQLILNVEHQTRKFGDDTYGLAFLGSDGRGRFCDVFYDRVLDAYHSGRADEATILGMVMAHELGHLLLGPDSHSATGLMRPQWHPKDFLPAEFVPTFTRQQVQKIRDRRKQITALERSSQ